jgi:hypothetical protein
VPELELGESANERTELLVPLRRQAASIAVLHIVVYRIVGWIKFGLQEGEEEVQKVDAQGVRDYRLSALAIPYDSLLPRRNPPRKTRHTDIPPLRDENTEEKDKQGDSGAYPSIEHMRSGLV